MNKVVDLFKVKYPKVDFGLPATGRETWPARQKESGTMGAFDKAG